MCNLGIVMRETDKKLLSTFEFRLRQLMDAHQKLKDENAGLKQVIRRKDEEIVRLSNDNEELKASYTNLKQVKIISSNDNDVKDTKLRLSRLVREVDKCIALLNE